MSTCGQREGQGGKVMDFYEVLKVTSSAKQVDIDRAYQKIKEEARYDASVNIKEVEIAYKILGDATQRALYDAKRAEKQKEFDSTARVKTRKRQQNQRVKIMKIILISLLLISAGYFFYRFGYMLKSFEEGDVLYFKDTDKYFGVVEKMEPDHNFGIRRTDAVLIKMSEETDIWLPEGDVAALCYKKE